MTLEIIISDIEITEWTCNLVEEYVHIHYAFKSSTGEEWRKEDAIFWVILPDEPVEGRDFQLPTTYAMNLLDLTNDAITALKTYWDIN